MQKKTFVDGMFDDDIASKVAAAVKGVPGVTNCEANPMKAQVVVDFEGADEAAIDAAIASAGASVL